MGLKLRRRAVYVGTIIALVATIGGLAVAAAIGGITITTTSGNQNYGSVNPGNTIYATGTVTATLSLTSGDGLTSGCVTAGTYASTTLSLPVAGAGSACPATSEWYDLLTFSGVSVASGDSDTFYISVNGGEVGTGIVVSTSGTFTPATLNLYIDDGPTTGAPQITSVSVTVAGS